MSKPIPPRADFIETISLQAIQNNDCSSLKVVKLFWGKTDDLDDTLRYQLSPEAAKVYRFAHGIPVEAKDERGKQFMSQCHIKRLDDDALLIRLKKNAPAFDPIDVLLVLETYDKPAKSLKFDPLYSSGGGPRY